MKLFLEEIKKYGLQIKEVNRERLNKLFEDYQEEIKEGIVSYGVAADELASFLWSNIKLTIDTDTEKFHSFCLSEGENHFPNQLLQVYTLNEDGVFTYLELGTEFDYSYEYDSSRTLESIVDFVMTNETYCTKHFKDFRIRRIFDRRKAEDELAFKLLARITELPNVLKSEKKYQQMLQNIKNSLIKDLKRSLNRKY